MSKFINPSDIKLEPCDAFWGKRQLTSVTCLADSSGSLNNKYFLLTGFNSDYEEIEYFVWYNVNDAGVNPALPNKTGIEVAVATDATASAVASATQAAIDAILNFSASVSGSIVLIKNAFFGQATESVDGSAATGFTITTPTIGFGGKLGASQGGITVSFENSIVDITSDQSGGTIIDGVLTGNNITVEMTLQEVTREKWSLLVGKVSGDEMTPTGGTKVVGVGESKRFKNMTQYAGELILVPVGAENSLRNHYFWVCTPAVESVNFSGEEVQVMPVSFRCFRDLSKDIAVNIWAFGDGTQDLSV